jgi:peroxisomal membrane protein 2
LGFLQEVLARHLAGVPPRKVHPSAGALEHLFAASKVNAKAFKMALFGFLVSAPLGHALVKTMHRVFAGRTGPGVKLGMMATSLLVVAPIQIAVFLTNSALIEGARTKEAVLKVVKKGFAPVLGVTWITSPTAIVFAQAFLPPGVRGFSRSTLCHREVIFAHFFPFWRSLRFPSSI